ncbi:4'-phosphopantetheinyl transferase superfamily protein [bacterium]|nr:MAG: 4'-phosphopantetheinyl transferase superfamily protein [bacterium]
MELLAAPVLASQIFADAKSLKFSECDACSFVIVKLDDIKNEGVYESILTREQLRLPQQKFVSKALARLALGRLLRVEPSTLRFHANENGKPFLSAEPRLSFNVSHSQTLWVMAASFERSVGVDLETIKSWERLEKIAARVFSPDENRLLSEIASEPLRVQTALAMWTSKEALVKLEGNGLFEGLAEFSFSLNPTRCLQRPGVDFKHFTGKADFVMTLASSS